MRTYRVHTPAPDFTGEVGGVHFVKGIAVVEAPAPLPSMRSLADGETFTRSQLAERDEIGQHPGYRAMAYFRGAGYRIEDITPDDEPVDDEPGEPASLPPVPARNASTDEWRAFAMAMGMPVDQASTSTRDQLVEHYTKEGLL